MRRKRISAFIIDFIIIVIAFYTINNSVPKTRSLKQLEAHENEIIEKYTSHQISFGTYFKSYSDIVYKIANEKKLINISYLAFIVIYFILLPFIWKGRTIGSYLNGIQIERFDKGYLFLHQLFIRNLIVIGLGYLIISNIGVFFLPSKYYFLIISIVGILQVVVALFSANMILFSKEKRGLQDLVSNTEMARIIR